MTKHFPSMPAPLVSLHDVVYDIGKKSIFQGVSFSVRSGELIGILGPTGVGKTTLLKLILGLLQPHRGSVLFEGRPAGMRREPVGYVPQLAAIDWDFPVTVEELVEMGWSEWAQKSRGSGGKLRRQVERFMERLGITECAGRQIRDLSSGQQQRAFLARALISEPRLVVLDEPTTGVDLGTQHEIFHFLGELNRSGMTILLTTHDVNTIAAHLPRLICLNREVIADGPPLRVFTPEILKRTYGAEMVIASREGFVMAGPATPL